MRRLSAWLKHSAVPVPPAALSLGSSSPLMSGAMPLLLRFLDSWV